MPVKSSAKRSLFETTENEIKASDRSGNELETDEVLEILPNVLENLNKNKRFRSFTRKENIHKK